MKVDAAPLLDSNTTATQESRVRYSRNVMRIFFVYFFSIAVRDVSFGALFDAYLLNLGGSTGNVLVGSVESIRGLLQMLLAYPLGVLADRMPRVRLCRYNMPFFTLGFMLLMSGILLDNRELIFVGMAVWAPAMQNWFSSSSAIVADSCPPETRTTTIANMSNVQLLASSLGPLTQLLILLVLHQDTWDMPLLHRVMGIGCVMWPLVIVGTCMLEELPPMEKTAAKGRSRFASADLNKPMVMKMQTRWVLAICLQLATTITSIGAGMTVKFFPLFFKVDYGFQPRDLCLLTFVYPLAMAVMQRICLKVSDRIGRLPAMMIFHFLGTAALLGMCYCENIWLLVPLYIMRGALMNAKQPINTAVTMDLVTSEMRGRWSSIQSIAGFSWSGSAFIGGWLAHSYGYRFSFFVTALVYTFSFFMYIPILFIFPKERGDSEGEAHKPCFTSPASNVGAALMDAGVPLLPDQVIDLDIDEVASPKSTAP